MRSKKNCSHGLFYPVGISEFYWRKIKEESYSLGENIGPLSHIVYPAQQILDDSPYVLSDPIGDRQCSVDPAQPFLIQKYPDRILFMPTFQCLGQCQYCFRHGLLESASKDKQKKLIETKLQKLIAHLNQHPDIAEVILSGGDPLYLSLSEMTRILETIHGIPTIKNIRLHTRAIVYDPKKISANRWIDLFKKYQVRLVFHIVHPYEICSQVEKTIRKLVSSGVRCYNQFPLLRNINDHSKVIIRLLELLDRLGVRNLSVFYPDAVPGSGPFRISFHRIFKIIDEVQWQTPSWVNAVKFCLDTEIGKVQRENLVKLDSKNHYAIFSREGKTVQYPDWPVEYDKPGDLKVMLWKE